MGGWWDSAGDKVGWGCPNGPVVKDELTLQAVPKESDQTFARVASLLGQSQLQQSQCKARKIVAT